MDAARKDMMQGETAALVRESAPALLRTPKGERLHIALFGRRNVGKSSVLNAIANQRISIVSSHAGTTTDPVDKPMELLPLGPVLFVDTAGLDDEGALGAMRIERTRAVFDRTDLGVLVTEAGVWGPYEDGILQELEERRIPAIIVFNKMDLLAADGQVPTAECQAAQIPIAEGQGEGVQMLDDQALDARCLEPLSEKARQLPHVRMSALAKQGVLELRQALLDNAPESFVNDPRIVSDIVPANATAVLVIPIDKEAPKGRLILPQVQVIRDLLDAGCMPYCCRETELAATLESLKEPPALVITDSQAFGTVAPLVPPDVPLTGFSVAFARYKGDLATQALGTLAIDRLNQDSRVLIAEACTHHPIQEDIGTVKIPRLLRARAGQGLAVDHVRGVDFPTAEELKKYDLVIHCGGCMFNRRMVLSRIQACVEAGVPVSNYGLTLAFCNGLFERSIRAFPDVAALLAL